MLAETPTQPPQSTTVLAMRLVFKVSESGALPPLRHGHIFPGGHIQGRSRRSTSLLLSYGLPGFGACKRRYHLVCLHRGDIEAMSPQGLHEQRCHWQIPCHSWKDLCGKLARKYIPWGASTQVTLGNGHLWEFPKCGRSRIRSPCGHRKAVAHTVMTCADRAWPPRPEAPHAMAPATNPLAARRPSALPWVLARTRRRAPSRAARARACPAPAPRRLGLRLGLGPRQGAPRG